MYQIFVISDATGATAERVVRAALTQFRDAQVGITRYGRVRSQGQVRQIVTEAAEAAGRGIIVHTLMSSELRELVFALGRQNHVPTIDLMGPLLARLTELLATKPLAEPGLFRPFDDAYLRRVEALRFAVRHDDARNTHELEQADIVLVGVSRTCKTPLSIYLANQGWLVANVPLMLGVNPPENLFDLPKRRVVMLMVQPERLAMLRGERARRLGAGMLNYADPDFVRRDVVNAYEALERRPDWPIVDMTSRSIEEAAEEIVSLVGPRGDRALDFLLET
jgi:regulator of PEP synthase PpsR (kinase-PPPase family)